MPQEPVKTYPLATVESSDAPKVYVREITGWARSNEPIRIGIPLPRGWLAEGRSASLSSGDTSLISQGRALAQWPDGSAKWYLVSTAIDLAPNELKTLELKPDDTAVKAGIEVNVRSDALEVDTGTARFRFPHKGTALVDQIIRDGRRLLDRPAVARLLIDGRQHTADHRITVLEHGPARVVLRFDGKWNQLRHLSWFGEIHLTVGSSTLRIDSTIRNSRPALHSQGCWDLGDPGSTYLQALTLELTLSGSGKACLVELTTGESIPRDNADKLSFLQESAGGEQWNSSNHIGWDRKPTVRFRGYRIDRDGVEISSGDRAQPVLTWISDDGGSVVSVTIDKTWQNAPKGLLACDSDLTIGLFPRRDDQLIELQGGEQKTHTVFIDAGAGAHPLRWTVQPLVVNVDADWIRASSAVRYLNHSADELEWTDLIQGLIEGEHSFFAKREQINELGWRHFGELYADHEGVDVPGPPHLVSHYNNQYDPLLGFLRQFMIDGNPRWWELAEALCGHVRDIDIYHTDGDREEYNGGMFWHTNHYFDAETCTHRSFAAAHAQVGSQAGGVDNWGRTPVSGGGPGLQHCYASGLAIHYLMTGDAASRDAVLILADWVRRQLSGPSTLLGTLNNARRTLSIARRTPQKKARFWTHPFTRGSGNALHTLLDALLVSGDSTFLDDAEALLAECASPDDQIDDRNLTNSELNWSYTVLLESIGRYLDVKLERSETDARFVHARDVLIHYAEWMGKHDDLYLKNRDELEYPTETWPAQDLRKAKVLLQAAGHAQPISAVELRRRALELFDEALEQLQSFGDKQRLTRPMVLLLQNYGMVLHYLQFGAEGQNASTNDGSPEPYQVRPRRAANLIWKQIRYALTKTSPAKEYRWLKHRLRRRPRRLGP